MKHLALLVVGAALAATLVACEPLVEPIGDTTIDLPTPNFAAVGPVTESVTGSAKFHRTLPNTGEVVWQGASFVARRYADGSVDGVYKTVPGRGFQGRVVCFTIVDNRAWIGVEVTKSAGYPPLGDPRAILVEDNGEGVNAPPDRATGSIRLRVIPGPMESLEQYCEEAPGLPDDWLHEVEAGNVQIHR